MARVPSVRLRLQRRHDRHIENIRRRAASRKIVGRLRQPLQERPDGHRATQPGSTALCGSGLCGCQDLPGGARCSGGRMSPDALGNPCMDSYDLVTLISPYNSDFDEAWSWSGTPMATEDGIRGRLKRQKKVYGERLKKYQIVRMRLFMLTGKVEFTVIERGDRNGPTA